MLKSNQHISDINKIYRSFRNGSAVKRVKWNIINADCIGVRTSLKTDGLLGSTHAKEPVLYRQAGEGKERLMCATLIFKALLYHADHTQVCVVSVICASPQELKFGSPAFILDNSQLPVTPDTGGLMLSSGLHSHSH